MLVHWIVSLWPPQHPSPGQDTRPSWSGHSLDEPQSIWGCPLDQESIQQNLTSATHPSPIPSPRRCVDVCLLLSAVPTCSFSLMLSSLSSAPETWREMPFLTLLRLHLALILEFPYCYPFFKDILSPPSNSHSKQGSSTPLLCLPKSLSLPWTQRYH